MIVGAYNTRQARVLDQPELEVLWDAVHGALASAGLPLSAVDGVNVTSSVRRLNAREAVMMFGARPSWTGNEIGIPAVIEAALAISAGLCEVAVIATAQAAEYTDRAATAPWTRPSNEFVECWGLFTPAEFALMARRHMHLYGTTSEQLAEIAVATRYHASMNPEALFRNPITVEDVVNSRIISSSSKKFFRTFLVISSLK